MGASHSPEIHLYYVMDPMCSWCWAFSTAFESLRGSLDKDVAVSYVMGGLAPDDESPMPESMRRAISDTWRVIEARTGARFNHDYWRLNTPRRSTYPACRAAIAAGRLAEGGLRRMVEAIQKAYYVEARNPSLEPVLIDIAESIGLSRDAFARELAGDEVRAAFENDLRWTRRLGVQGFPAVIAARQDPRGETRYALVSAGYCDTGELQARWRAADEALGGRG